MHLTIPPSVKPGERAYIVSPSAGLIPFAPERAKRAVKNLQAMGFEVVMGGNAAKNNGYVSGSIEERLADIHEAFSDNRCTLIMASIGGNNSNQLLPFLDFDLIRNNPKIFCGYSDVTALHLAIAAKSGLRTYYGPCLMTQFGEVPGVLPYTLDSFSRAISDTSQVLTYHPSPEYTDETLDWFTRADEARARQMRPSPGYQWWRAGTATGWALPVTLPTYNHVVNTEYAPDPAGAILMIDLPEGYSMHEGISLSDIDAWLTDLYNAGVLAKIKGLALARPYKGGAKMSSELKKLIMRITSQYDYPVVANLDFGHTDPIVTIPIGARLDLDSASQKLTFTT